MYYIHWVQEETDDCFSSWHFVTQGEVCRHEAITGCNAKKEWNSLQIFISKFLFHLHYVHPSNPGF